MKTLLAITTYNQIKFTKLCIESLKNINIPGLDIIFIDDVSKDGTVKYLTESKYLFKGRGTPKGFNYGRGTRKGVSLSEKHKRKIGLEKLSKRHNEEFRKRMGGGKVGVPRSDEFKNHMRSVLGGKKRDPEIGKKISEGHRRRRESDTET